MKKLMGLFCALLTLALVPALMGCGKDMSQSPYVGEWSATTASMSGITMDITDLYPDGFTLDLQSNGKVVLNVGGEETSGSWEETDDGFTIEDEFTVTVDGDNGTMDYDGLAIEFVHQS